MEREMVLRMLLFSYGAAGVFAAVLLAVKSGRRSAFQIAVFSALAAASLALYASNDTSSAYFASVTAFAVAFMAGPPLMAGAARHLAGRGAYRAAAAASVVRFGLTLSPPALLHAAIYRGFAVQSESGPRAALEYFKALRLAAPPDRRRVVDGAFIGAALARGAAEEAEEYVKAIPDASELARSGPSTSLAALGFLLRSGQLDSAARLVGAMAALHPESIPFSAIVRAYSMYLGAMGDAEGVEVLAAEAAALSASGAARPEGAVAAEPAGGIRLQVPWPPRLCAPGGEEGWDAVSPPISRAPGTAAFLAANCIIMAAQVLRNEADDSTALAAWGAAVDFLVRAGQFWRWGSCTLIHFGWLHIFMNMLALYVLGRFVEGAYGTPRFLLVYLLSGFAGSMTSFLVTSAPISAGASGAVFGLIGMGLAFTAIHGGKISKEFRNRNLALFTFVIVANVIYGFSESFIDNSAHIGGLACGAFATLFLTPSKGREGARPGAGSAALWICLAASSAAFLLCIAEAGLNLASGGVIPDMIRFERRDFGDGISAEIPAHWTPVSGERGAEYYQDVLPLRFFAPRLIGSDIDGRNPAFGHVLMELLEREPGISSVRRIHGPAGQFRFSLTGAKASENIGLAVFVQRSRSLVRLDFVLRGKDMDAFARVIDRVASSSAVDASSD